MGDRDFRETDTIGVGTKRSALIVHTDRFMHARRIREYDDGESDIHKLSADEKISHVSFGHSEDNSTQHLINSNMGKFRVTAADTVEVVNGDIIKSVYQPEN